MTLSCRDQGRRAARVVVARTTGAAVPDARCQSLLPRALPIEVKNPKQGSLKLHLQCLSCRKMLVSPGLHVDMVSCVGDEE